METNFYTYSLCYSLENSHGQMRTYRVADYDLKLKKFIEIAYKRPHSPYIINRSPDDFIVKGEAELIKWQLNADYKDEQYSYPATNELNGNIYELIFPNEIPMKDSLDDNKIRRRLYLGFDLLEDMNEDFLMVVGSSTDKYLTIKCHINDFTKGDKQYYLERDINDILNTRYLTKKYEIPKEDIVSTELLRREFSETHSPPIRYFYSYSNLPPSIGNFMLHNETDFTNSYLVKYLRKFKNRYDLTNYQQKQIAKIISDALYDNEILAQFVDEVDYEAGNLLELLKENIEDVIDLYEINGELDFVINNFLLQDERIKSDYMKEIRSEWERESIDEIEDVEKEIERNKLKLDNVTQKIEEGQSELIEQESKLKNVKQDIQKQLDSYHELIIDITKTSGIIKASGLELNNNERSQNKLLVSPGEVSSGELFLPSEEEIITLEDLIISFSDNLTKYFDFDSFESQEISGLIVLSLLTNRLLVVPNMHGYELAMSLSVLLEEMTPTKIYISSSENSADQVIKAIEDSASKVIYIDGILDIYNEQLLNIIYHNSQGKFIFVGLGDDRLLTDLSPYIWNEIIYIDSKEHFTVADDEPLVATKTNPELLRLSSFNNEDFVHKTFKAIKKNKLISKPNEITFSFIQNNLEGLSIVDSISKLLIKQIYIMNLGKEETQDTITKVLSQSEISPYSLDEIDLSDWVERND